MNKRADQGFSFIELLVVVVILGVLATVVVVAVGGMETEAENSACRSDATVLFTATEAFFAQRHVQTITPADGTTDGYEKTLVTEQFLHRPSQYFDLDAAGRLVTSSGSPCTVQ